MCIDFVSAGVAHVYSISGFKHVLFLVAVCSPFVIRDWIKVLSLLTAFTMGHLFTLILAALHIVDFSPYWIDLFIPLTILLASLQNLVRLSDKTQNRLSLYPLVLSFSFIHSLGVSNSLASMASLDGRIVMPLFAFNLGIDFAQLGLVVIIMVVGYLLTSRIGLKQKIWIVTTSSITAIVSCYMICKQIL